MKKNLTVLIVTVLFVAKTVAQVESRDFKNAIHFELLGAGLFYSVNYERIVTVDMKTQLSMGAGLEIFNNNGAVITSANFINGSKHNLELGCGLLLIDNENLIYSRIGYRYKKESTIFRAGLTPFLNFRILGKEFILPWIGISFGKAF
jgi:hypothetical protein